jgi:hypothetical protein
VKYLGLIIMICWLVEIIKSKRAGMCGSYVTKENDPATYYAYVVVVAVGVIFAFLYVLGFFES